jgi:hypothetical protein
MVTHLAHVTVLEDKNAIRNRGNEIHVVADHDAGPVTGIPANHIHEPHPLIGVEVLGRFVEQ